MGGIADTSGGFLSHSDRVARRATWDRSSASSARMAAAPRSDPAAGKRDVRSIARWSMPRPLLSDRKSSISCTPAMGWYRGHDPAASCRAAIGVYRRKRSAPRGRVATGGDVRSAPSPGAAGGGRWYSPGHVLAHPSGPDLPVRFSQRRLAGGLRVIVAPDHLAPVVAINLWYDVGSRHGWPARPASRTCSSISCSRAAAMSPSRSTCPSSRAGGVNNATVLRPDQLLRDAPSTSSTWGCGWRPTGWPRCWTRCRRKNLDNQREVVKNEKRQRHDNRPTARSTRS